MKSERLKKKLRLEAETDEGEEMLRLKERVKELENLVEEGKRRKGPRLKKKLEC